MSYQNVALAWLHAARDAGTSAITLATGTENVNTPKSRLIDGMGRYPYSVTPDAGVIELDLDRQSAGLEAIDRFPLLPGHSLGGDTLEILSDDNAGFSSPTTVFGPTALAAGSSLQDLVLTSTSERYLRFRLDGLDAVERDIPELWYSRRRSLNQGVVPEFLVNPVSQINRVRGRAGYTSTRELGANLWKIQLDWERLPVADADIMRDFRSGIGGSRDPFWVWPPDDAEFALALFELDADLSGRQGHPNPASDLEYTYSLRATEKLV